MAPRRKPDIPPASSLLPAIPPGLSIKDRAKQLYMERKSANDISRELGITTNQLASWRTEGDWALERESNERGMIEDGFAGRKISIHNILNVTVEQLHRGVQHLANRHEPASLQECERLSVIVGNLDKIGRLDANKATDNVAINATVKMTQDEIRKVILNDPFFVANTEGKDGETA